LVASLVRSEGFRLMTSYRRDAEIWEELARVNPTWAICSQPQFYGVGTPPETFWASGHNEVEGVLAALEAAGIEFGDEVALDFGCGLGRLTRPLAGRFGRVVGVDVSETMVETARRIHADCPGCVFEHNVGPDLRRYAPETFDFILSLIALQHIRSRRRVCAFVAEFVRLLRPGGIAVVQVPARVPWSVRWHPLRIVARWLGPGLIRRLPNLSGYAMAITAVPSHRLSAAIEDAGGSVVLAVPDNRVGSPGIESLAYVISAPNASMAAGSRA
jgi:2-polyprenyl-3-methyl-5-hydroxy-6-metoxy-1,4-benzoquinol methylase